MGALTSEQNEMFLRNPRFLGLKFPDMTRPETLEKRYSGIMAKKELSFMKVMPSNRMRFFQEPNLCCRACCAWTPQNV
jgi:hypothetical protein